MQLSCTNEAAELQEHILQACIKSLGPENPKILKVLNTLGSLSYLQGRLQDALRFGREALDGVSRTLGTDNEDTLQAMENVGRVHARDFRFQEVRHQHDQNSRTYVYTNHPSKA